MEVLFPFDRNGSFVNGSVGFESSFLVESGFDYRETHKWMQEHWTDTFLYSGLYLLTVFGIKRWMRERPSYSLKGPLIAWNMILASFSILGSVKMVPEMLELLGQENGLHRTMCMPVPQSSTSWAFWTWLFVLSKLPELGDTFFIVLRKQPLIFLHWYHHITVMIYSWYAYSLYVSPSRWYVVMNYVVHSCMYSYFVLRALRMKIPKQIAIAITTFQILQMVVGTAVNVYAYNALASGKSCDVTYTNIACAIAMYTSYFLLFAQFFHKAYLAKRPGPNKKQN